MAEAHATASTELAVEVAAAILMAMDIARECDPLSDVMAMIEANGGLVPLPEVLAEAKSQGVTDMELMAFIGDVGASVLETLYHYQIISRGTRWMVYANMVTGMVSVAPADLLYGHVAQKITDQQFRTHPELGN